MVRPVPVWFLSLVVLSACTPLGSLDDYYADEDIDFVIQSAVWTHIDSETIAVVRAVRAMRIVNITNDVLSVIEGNPQIAVMALEMEARSRIDWDALTPVDMLAIDALIIIIRDHLNRHVLEHPQDEHTMLGLTPVFTLIRDAAQLRIPRTASDQEEKL